MFGGMSAHPEGFCTEVTVEVCSGSLVCLFGFSVLAQSKVILRLAPTCNMYSYVYIYRTSEVFYMMIHIYCMCSIWYTDICVVYGILI